MTFWQKLRASVIGFGGYADLAEARDRSNGLGYILLLLPVLALAYAKLGQDMWRLLLDMVGDPEVLATAGQFGGVAAGFLLVVGYIIQIPAKCINALILAVVARVYGNMKERQVDFAMGWRLGLHAMTVPIGIQLVELVTSGLSQSPWRYTYSVLFWAVSLVYLTKGLGAVWARADRTAQVAEQPPEVVA